MINAVVDISHHNGNVNLVKAQADGLIGVIQKATQGQSFVDPTYKTNRKKALDAELSVLGITDHNSVVNVDASLAAADGTKASEVVTPTEIEDALLLSLPGVLRHALGHRACSLAFDPDVGVIDVDEQNHFR